MVGSAMVLFMGLLLLFEIVDDSENLFLFICGQLTAQTARKIPIVYA